jgi:nondiscriminating glutamyl-tRNA synthetase
MILGPDGKKLSKRHGATSAEEFRNRGYLPEALLNYLALLGWSHPEGKEILTLNEIIDNFTFDRVNSSPAVFDEKKLKWMNGNYIRNTDADRILKLSIPFIIESGLLSEEQCEDNKKWLKEAIELVKTSVEELSEVPDEISIFIKNFEPDLENKEFIEYLNADGVKNAFRITLDKFNNDEDWTVSTVLDNLKIAMKDAKPAKKPFYMALRKALTNQFHGPDLVRSVHLIGRARAIERLEMVIENEY